MSGVELPQLGKSTNEALQEALRNLSCPTWGSPDQDLETSAWALVRNPVVYPIMESIKVSLGMSIWAAFKSTLR